MKRRGYFFHRCAQRTALEERRSRSMKVFAVCLVAAALIAAASAVSYVPGSVYQLYLFNDTATPNAVCNDGSPAGVYYAPSQSESAADKWIVHLQGGAWCSTVEECEQRAKDAPDLTSSKQWKSALVLQGMLSGDPKINPHLYDYNRIFVAYCTSDAFTGTQNASGSGEFVFAGRSVVLSVLRWIQAKSWSERLAFSQPADASMHSAVVKNTLEKPLTAPSVLVWSGCSAGGQGVVNTLDLIANSAPSLTVVGVAGQIDADAGWLMNLTTFDPSKDTSLMDVMKRGMSLWTGEPNMACLASPTMKDAPHLCYFSNVAYPFIKTPLYIQTEQYDAYQLPWDIGYLPAPFNETSSSLAFREHFRQEFASSLYSIVSSSEEGGVYSGACDGHCLTMSDGLYTNLRVPLSSGRNRQYVSIMEHLGSWIGARIAAREPTVLRSMTEPQQQRLAFVDLPRIAIDHCVGFNCTVGCPSTPFGP